MRTNISLFFAITLLAFVSCQDKKVIVPASRIELQKSSGFVSENTTRSSGDLFSVKLWIYSHYSFNRIEVKRQIIAPNVETPEVVRIINSNDAEGGAFTSNYTTNVSNLNVGNFSNVTQKWTFIMVDNKGISTETSINIEVYLEDLNF